MSGPAVPTPAPGAVVLDGGLGQELVRRSAGPATAAWSAQALLDDPGAVGAVHDEFLAAGAQVTTADTYVLSRERLGPVGLADRLVELTATAGRVAVGARDRHGAGLVAGSLGPLTKSYRPDLAPRHDEAAETYAELARLQAPWADLLLCETMASVDMVRGVVAGATTAGPPVWVAVTVRDDDGSRLRSGEPVEDVVEVARRAGVEALLVNCARPEAVDTAVGRLAPAVARAGMALGAYANGFAELGSFLDPGTTADVLERRRDLTPDAYAVHATRWRQLGAAIIGGCCEVGPAHVAALAEAVGS